MNEPLVQLASDPESLIVHPHAQRTGGGTIRNHVLAAAFGKERVYSRMFVRDYKPWNKLTDKDLRHYRAYTDLSNYCDQSIERHCLPIALLRDPVHRAVSLYHFVRRKQTHEFHQLASSATLEEFYRVGSSKNPVYFRNLQATRVCGSPDARLAQEYLLTRYLAVGFTRHIDAFAGTLSQIFGWSNVHVELRAGVERHDAEITSKFREMVLNQNEEDQLLFEAMWNGVRCRIPRASPPRAIVRQAKRLRDKGLRYARGAQRRIFRAP